MDEDEVEDGSVENVFALLDAALADTGLDLNDTDTDVLLEAVRQALLDRDDVPDEMVDEIMETAEAMWGDET